MYLGVQVILKLNGGRFKEIIFEYFRITSKIRQNHVHHLMALAVVTTSFRLFICLLFLQKFDHGSNFLTNIYTKTYLIVKVGN